jgi:hypothetical protein
VRRNTQPVREYSETLIVAASGREREREREIVSGSAGRSRRLKRDKRRGEFVGF